MNATLSEIKAHIRNGNLEKAGQELLGFTQKNSSRFFNEVIGQIASLKQALSDERKGVASAETTKMHKSRITYALLDLIDEVDEELSSPKSGKKSGGKGKDVVFEGPIGQVIIQQSRSGDNIVEKKEKVIKIGGNARISAPIVIADSIENSFNALAKSNLNEDTKALLEQLLKAIADINKQVKPEQTESAESMARDAESLVNEATNPKPRRKWYEVSMEGLKHAATNIGEVATPVLEIVGKLSPLLLG
jgi:hypothetical protein